MLYFTILINPLRTGLEVIKLEFIHRLKIKHNDWLLADTCPQVANQCAYFEFERLLKFYDPHKRVPWQTLKTQMK